MVAHCLREGLEFGMVLAENKAVATIGSTAEIVRKIKEYPDGRMDIITEGRVVFRLVEVLEEKEYYEGLVEYPDDDVAAQDPQTEAQLRGLFEKYRTLLTSEPWVTPDRSLSTGDASVSLAYSMVTALPLGNRERQILLEMRSEELRRGFLIRWIGDSLPSLVERQRLRNRSGGNGNSHGPN